MQVIAEGELITSSAGVPTEAVHACMVGTREEEISYWRDGCSPHSSCSHDHPKTTRPHDFPHDLPTVRQGFLIFMEEQNWGRRIVTADIIEPQGDADVCLKMLLLLFVFRQQGPRLDSTWHCQSY